MEESTQEITLLDIFAKIEAVLFAYADPISIAKLSNILDVTVSDCKKYLKDFSNQLNNDKNRGVNIVFLEDSVQLVSKKEFAEYIKDAMEEKNNYILTPVSMEVLSIIAYNQPVTKGFIEQVRGTNSNGIVNSLVEKGLIEEAGRLDILGKPISYRTTKIFLRTFGLTDLSELPPLESLNEEQISLEEEIILGNGDNKWWY